MFEPCFEHCYLRYGKQYTKECDNNCNYAKTIKILKTLLGCEYCKRYLICPVGDCNNYEKYEIDFEKIKTNYKIV